MKTLHGMLRRVWWDVHNENTRFALLSMIVGNIPGETGVHMRGVLYKKYVKSSGSNIWYHKQVTILNPGNLIIGDHVHIGAYDYIQAAGGVIIGDHTILGPYVKIWSANHRFQDPEAWIQDQGYDLREVRIGRHVWIGAGAFIMPGADIGDRCIISACSVVGAKKYPSNIILSGNPARKIGDRPATHDA